jgi:predicted nucleic-acid-binding protein
VLKAIASAETKSTSQRVRILLDTNFLFSILSLHDNPSNEVAQDLIRLTTQAKPNIRVELYVLPITVEETRRVLREVMARLSGMVLTKNIAAAAVKLSSSGLFNQYMQAAGEFQDGILTAEALSDIQNGVS